MAKPYPQSTQLGKYPVPVFRLPTVYEPDQPVYADESAYQATRFPQAGEAIPGQNVVYGSSPTEQAVGQNSPGGEVPTVEGVEVDGGLNMKQLRDFAKLVYPEGETPTMEYGQDVNVRIPFTKRSLFKMSGKKMDKLAGALAAAAQGAYVPGSDPGGQFLKGFLQGYGGVRSQGYAERKKEFETKQAAFKANAEARSKLIGQLGLEGYKAMMKPAKAGSDAYVTLTQGMVDELRRTTGKVFPKELVGQTVPKSMLTGSPPDPGGLRGESLSISRQGQELQAAQNWTNSPVYQGHLRRVQTFATISNLGAVSKTLPDYAVSMFINKMIDPDSAVLMGESRAWTEGTNLANRLRAKASATFGQGKFSDEDRRDVANISKLILDESTRMFKNELKSKRGTLATIGLNPEVIQDIETPSSSTMTPAEKAKSDPNLR